MFRNILVLIIFTIGAFALPVEAKVVFSTEEDGVHSQAFYIDSGDTADDFIDLEFGVLIDARLRYDVLLDKFVINRDLEITQEVIDSDGNTGTSGQVLVADGAGKNLWQNFTTEMTPYISAVTPSSLGLNFTGNIAVAGKNFLPTSTVSIPSFTGTINSTNVVSPEEIQLYISTGNMAGVYDLIVANGATNNTAWSGNEVGWLTLINNNGVTSSTPGLSCKDILDNGYSTGDGTYWIDPNGGSNADSFQVFCDMTTDGGGWTRIDYVADLTHQAQFTGSDANRWLTSNFTLVLTDTQINDIRSVSTEGKQKYVGSCQGVIHYLYQTSNYAYAFGFRFHDGHETAFNQQTYPSSNITVPVDGCKVNNNTLSSTEFDILDVRLPVLNVHSRDNSSTEQFGSPLTANPAWLR